jgi:hypothetical protein
MVRLTVKKEKFRVSNKGGIESVRIKENRSEGKRF